jgi:hypothetical protein
MNAALCYEDAGMSGLDDTPAVKRAELRSDVALMRELGVLQWKDIVLGSDPVATENTTQPSRSPEELQRELVANRRRIALASSGGPVKLGGRDYQGR